ncbi:hypothetical protein MAR_013401 [Mya arenaria]|uniref:THD domain-containing protein n=1 Tax=Mya arenaria TaxID=6604 RepID=A0ABY7FZT8_MYAAR|nr:uncharacterized protein LOC128220265 [Mya arenaria]WAR27697.1 hypothetical protein MAR_013401 [Mya arenaria]
MDVLRLLSVFVLIVTVLQIGSFLSVVVVWKYKRDDILVDYYSTICDHAVANGDDERVPCKGVESLLKAEIDKEIKRRARNGLRTESSLPEILGYDKCLETREISSILLDGISTNTQGKGSGIVHWLSVVNSDQKGNLSYNDGSLHIAETGFYYLAFQLMVTIPENKERSFERESENTQIEHTLMHRSANGAKTTVLRNVRHGGCQARTKTISTGSVFKFKGGESVHLHTSSMQSIASDTGHHSFMMYKI